MNFTTGRHGVSTGHSYLNILTVRLARLTSLGILERFPLEDRANTEGYRLTQKGEELYPVIVALMQWGDPWLACDGKPPTLLVEDATGEPIERVAVRTEKSGPLSFHDVRFAPGPGATESTPAVLKNRNERVLEGTSRKK